MSVVRLCFCVSGLIIMAQQLWLIFSGTYATFSILNRGSVMADLLIRLCHIRQMVR